MSKSKIHILLVDDDNYFRMAVKSILSDIAIFSEADNEDVAKSLLSEQYFDLALVDMNLAGPKTGIAILKAAKLKSIHTITLSSQTEDEIIEEAYLNGCNHFLSKFNFNSHLKPYIQSFIKQYINSPLKDFFTKKYITQDEGLKTQIENLSKYNLRNKTILLTGETGVGKSVLGEFIHKNSHTEEAPFIHINCSEVPENLIESELFGHKKGSFTGALNDKEGKLQQANGGTLFLDEIGTMSKSMQQKVLNAIENGSYYPVGASKAIKSQFTLITATCEDLFSKIANKEFREDLYYRISGINLNVPPLRNRKEDIPLLVQHFMNNYPRRVVIKEEAVNKIKEHSWPGNTRELKKYLELIVLSSDGIISAEDIQFSKKEIINDSNNFLTSFQEEYIKEYGLRSYIKKLEQECVKSTLLRHKGKITHAIGELKISSSAFYRIFEDLHQ